MFSQIPAPAPDPLYAVAASYAADPRAGRMDLGVGVYRDGSGHSPVMAAVKHAEARLVEQQSSKAYRPLLGDPDFLEAMTTLAFGAETLGDNDFRGRLVAMQVAGGTGGLRLAAALVSSALAVPRVHLGLPSWPSHAGVFRSEGFEVVEHQYWRPFEPAPSFDDIRAAASDARADDIFIFHGPCHNPTGADLDMAQRRELVDFLAARGATPLFDVAYYGLGSGLDADLAVLRELAGRSERMIVSLSCSKAFGLYRERTGSLFVLCASADEAMRVSGRLGPLNRLMISSSPAHGAEVVATILKDAELASQWRGELDEMRDRIRALREALAGSGMAALAGLREQQGIFAMLPLDSEQVTRLRTDHAIHMPASGRVNLAGLRDADVAPFIAALGAVGLS